ncbi:MAG: phosphohydrolase [Deltaproteobacteria bacterium]|nr:phosphohydrolase [Deltaproteobacteria bacterium]
MRCPGQDSRYWKPGDIFEAPCSKCGHPVEFFKDESSRRCKNCGNKFINPRMDFGCAAYCKFADQCLGELPPELLAQRKELLKDRVAVEVKHHLQNDFKRIGQAVRVARYAEQIVKEENGDPAIVLIAAYLHPLVTPGGGQKDDTAARNILTKLGVPSPLAEEVFTLLSHLDVSRPNDSANFQVLHDAVEIANWEERQKEAPLGAEKLAELIEEKLFTEAGRRWARNLLKI